eukprot:1140629-Pelagomonas_calceolata.AAC.3
MQCRAKKGKPFLAWSDLNAITQSDSAPSMARRKCYKWVHEHDQKMVTATAVWPALPAGGRGGRGSGCAVA